LVLVALVATGLAVVIGFLIGSGIYLFNIRHVYP
jgi:hypothetical protein